MKFKCMLLSERRQPEKATYCMTPIIWHSRKGKSIEKKQVSVVGKGWACWKDE
jgi:hypothetical protein